ncbi:MAG: hypothetical protein AAGC66_00290 [Leifsonia sp.]
MNDQNQFVAVLLYPDSSAGDDRVVLMPRLQPAPPTHLEVITDYAGVAAFDVFELVDDSEWPSQVVFEFRETIPQTLEDARRLQDPS